MIGDPHDNSRSVATQDLAKFDFDPLPEYLELKLVVSGVNPLKNSWSSS